MFSIPALKFYVIFSLLSVFLGLKPKNYTKNKMITIYDMQTPRQMIGVTPQGYEYLKWSEN